MIDARLQLKALLPTDLRHKPWIEELSLRTHDVDARTLLFAPGETTQHVYFVAKGWLAGRISLGKDKTAITHLRLRGDIIGLSMLSDQPVIGSSVSLTKVELISVPRRELERVMQTHPSLAHFIYKEQARDILSLQIFNTIIGQFKAPHRLACFLFVLFARSQQAGQYPRKTIRIPLTQEEIGQILGLTNVSVNRAFRTLESEDLIKTNRQLITVINLEGLAKRGQLGPESDLIALYLKGEKTISHAA